MKKAKLDILEEIPDLDIGLSETEIFADQRYSDVNEIRGKWAFNKLLIIGIPIMLVTLFVGGIIIYYMLDGASSRHKAQQMVKSGVQFQANQHATQRSSDNVQLRKTLSAKLTTFHLKDFMIDLKDAGGNNHLLIFDVVFDVGGELRQNTTENSSSLRNAIYKTAQNKSVVALRSVEERKKLKKDLASALEKILGEGSVKNLFFTNFLIM
jgi:flagellar basal body-associated protein FliL